MFSTAAITSPLTQTLLDTLPHPAMIINRERKILLANSHAIEAGAEVGRFCWQTFGHAAFLSDEHMDLYRRTPLTPGIHCYFCRADQCLDNQSQENDPAVQAFGKTLNTYWVAINNDTYLHYTIDITDHAKARLDRDEARKGLERSQLLLNEVGGIGKVGGWDFNIDTKELLWTEEVYHIHEVDMDYEPTVEKGVGFYSEEFKPVIAAAVKRATEQGEPFDLEMELITAKGNLRHVRAIGKANLDSRRVFGFFQDITEKKMAEKEREQLISKLQEKTEDLERFVYTVSHDLKSPLVTVSGFLNIIEQDHVSGNDDEFHSHLTVIKHAANRMKQLIAELLEISRVGNKRQPVECINLGVLIQEAIENLAGSISETNATVEVVPNLPEIKVEKLRILQVIENLIANAIRYSSSQKEPPVIYIGAHRSDGEITCYVRDNGIGIEPNNLNRVFDLYERIDLNSDGTGVGLSIVRRIVEVHGGKIWAESEGLGHGTTFFFTLPEATS